MKILSDAAKAFAAKKSRSVHPSFFISLANRFPALAWSLWADIVEGLTTTTNNYVRAQSLSILKATLNFPALGVSVLTATATATVAMFSHLLQLHESLHTKSLQDTLRVYQQWTKALRCSSVRLCSHACSTNGVAYDAAGLPALLQAVSGSSAKAAIKALCQQVATLHTGTAASAAPTKAAPSAAPAKTKKAKTGAKAVPSKTE